MGRYDKLYTVVARCGKVSGYVQLIIKGVVGIKNLINIENKRVLGSYPLIHKVLLFILILYIYEDRSNKGKVARGNIPSRAHFR